jgi:hypothetical protein
MDQCLPDMDGGLSDDVDSVLPRDEQGRKNPVTSFSSQNFDKSALGRFCHGSICGFILLNLILATDARDLEQ